MGVKSAIDWVIETIGSRSFSDEQVSYDFVMFVLIVVSAHRINPGHNRDFESKFGYSNRTRPFFSPRPNERKKSSLATRDYENMAYSATISRGNGANNEKADVTTNDSATSYFLCW